MEQSLPKAFDATSVKPEGWIKIVYNTSTGYEPMTWFFHEMGKNTWHWSDDGMRLIVTLKGGGRVEYIKDHIFCVEVQANSELYTACQEYLVAHKHQEDVSDHLLLATVVEKHKKERAEALWPATS